MFDKQEEIALRSILDPVYPKLVIKSLLEYRVPILKFLSGKCFLLLIGTFLGGLSFQELFFGAAIERAAGMHLFVALVSDTLDLGNTFCITTTTTSSYKTVNSVVKRLK